jgi:hypothetical protein
MHIIQSHQQRTDRRLPHPPKNAIETSLSRDASSLTTICIQRHGHTGKHPTQQRIKRLADQTEWQHRPNPVTPPDTNRKPRPRRADRMLKHRGLTQPSRPDNKQRPTPARASTIEQPLQRTQHTTTLNQHAASAPISAGRTHHHAPSHSFRSPTHRPRSGLTMRPAGWCACRATLGTARTAPSACRVLRSCRSQIATIPWNG